MTFKFSPGCYSSLTFLFFADFILVFVGQDTELQTTTEKKNAKKEQKRKKRRNRILPITLISYLNIY
ncbi:unnamed protein product [Amoebophrya sp. A25]|nr:unnamed protein product [Amoebophrya sp. A25]|eukprot:GSA25T00014518001.1